MRRAAMATLLVVWTCGVPVPASGAAARPKFQSPPVTSATKGHAVEVDIDIAGAKQLYLIVTVAGDSFACDWADWAEPRLVGPAGEKKLTDLKWALASAGWGQVRVNRNCNGGPLRIAGEAVEYGIGTHAHSVIAFDLPEGYTRFKARAGLDDGGTEQNNGGSTSVEFLVYTEKPPARILKGGGEGPAGDLPPDEALAALEVHPDLEVTLFAAEPMLLSPSNIDIDHLGRVWVCEIVNYRHFANKDNPPREEGDRILILADSDGDGRADQRTVFYQGRDIDSPHGVCVLPTPELAGTRAIVSAGENVFLFTDADGDGRADRKDVLFTGIGGAQHDHGIHAFVFGPDGRFYFNFGNAGKQIKDKHGRPVVDLAGNEVNDSRQPYQEGMIFRCEIVPDPAGGYTHRNFETLAWNFRNNWEVAVDSFGTLWQSDNDDDGNRGVRINYVMEFGNYGYKDELTGAGWQQPRTGMHPEIPYRHWHQNDPGVVPNLLQTGAGSPTGICVYEGDLLPEAFRGQMIHCDAGPNVVRAYPVEPDGAGYKPCVVARSPDRATEPTGGLPSEGRPAVAASAGSETRAEPWVNILQSGQDQWFRPSDVCVAPDGSLIVADWYDPGVGGHRMGDLDQGRLYRVAPPKSKYTLPKYDFATPEGGAEALKSPNLAARYMAWTALHAMQETAAPALHDLLHNGKDLRHRARALWLLSRIKSRGYVNAARVLDHPEVDLVITALRAIRRMAPEMDEFVSGTPKQTLEDIGAPGLLGRCIQSCSLDASPHVRRECLIALKHVRTGDAPRLWAELAAQYAPGHPAKPPGAGSSDSRGTAEPVPSGLGRAADRWYLEALGLAAEGRWTECFAAWLSEVGDRWNTPAGRDIVWRSRSAAALPLLAKIILDPHTPADELPRSFRAFDFHHSDDVRQTKQSVLAELALKADGPNAATIAELALSHIGSIDLGASPELRTAVVQALQAARGTSRFVQLVDRFNLADRYTELLVLAQQHPDEQVGVEAIRVLLAKQQQRFVAEALSDTGNNSERALATARVLGNALDASAVEPLSRVFRDENRPAELRREAARALAKTRDGAMQLLRRGESGQLDPVVKEAVAAGLTASSQPEIRERAAKLFPLPPTKDNQPLPPIEQLVQRTGDAVQGRILFNTTATCVKCHQVDGIGKDVGPDLTEIGSKLSRHALYESLLYPSAGISHNYETHTLVLDSGNTVSGILTSRTDQEVSIKGDDAIVRRFPASQIDEIVKQDISLMPADIQKTMTLDDLVHVVEYMATLRKRPDATGGADR